MRSILAGTIALVLVPSLLADPQDGASPPARAAVRSWSWVRFGTESGLPSATVFEVEISPLDGIPWANTSGGIAWFDGWRWHGVDAPGLRAREALDFQVGPREVWAIDLDERLHRGDQHRGLSAVDVVHEGVEHRVRRVVALADGGALLECVHGRDVRLLHLDSTGETSLIETDTPLASVWPAPHGRAWVETQTSMSLYGSGDPPWTIDKDEEACSALLDLGGRLVVSLSSPHDRLGVWTYSARGEARVLLPGVIADDLSSSAPGQLVVVDRTGELEVVALEPGVAGTDAAVESLPAAKHCFCFHRDDTGNTWVGTADGLYLHEASSRRSHVLRTPDRGSRRNNALSLGHSRDGTLHVGSSGGLETWSAEEVPSLISVLTEVDGEAVRVVTGIAEDDADRLWITSGSAFRGAFVREDDRWRRGPTGPFAGCYFHRIARDRAGRLWFLALTDHPDDRLADGPGVYVMEGERPTLWPVEWQGERLRVYDFLEDRQGRYWFATSRVLLRGRAPDALEAVSQPLWPKAPIVALAEARDGSIWFATRWQGIGLARPNGDVERPESLQGVPFHSTLDLDVDERDRLWITNGAGLSVFREGELHILANESCPVRGPFFPVHRHQGRIYGGSLGGGVVILDLDAGRADPRIEVDPPLVRDGRAELSWSADARWARLEPHHIQTRWRLDGEPWSAWSTSRSLQLDGLPHGEHRLEVQARDDLGTIAPNTARSRFRVDRIPPWSRRPAIVVPLASALLLALAFAIQSWRARRRFVRELAASEARLREHLDRTSLAVISWDRAFRVMGWNPAAQRIFGYRHAEARGRSARELILTEDLADTTEASFRELLNLDQDSFEETHDNRTADGRRITCAWHNTLVRDDRGRVQRVISIAQDVTERRRLEQELRQAQKMEAVGRLAGGISHDFNNVLTSIIGNLDLTRLALHGQLPEDHRCWAELQEIEEAARKATRLTHQLLQFSRRRVNRLEVFRPAEVLRSMEGMLRRLIRADIALGVEAAPDSGNLRADPASFEQIVLNLAVNAADAMPEGGRLEVVLRAAGSSVVLEVIDDGTGMPPEVRDRIFDPFFTTKPVGQGTGLGLATVHGIVEQLGGSIEVDSRVGVGTTFRIRLPGVDDAAAPASLPPPHSSTPPGHGTVLVCEDDDAVRRLTTRTLQEHGYEVHSAGHPERALQLSRELPDLRLLVTDVIMPGMSGRRLAEELRRERPELRVLFVSGHVDEEMERRVEAQPATDFLHKPFTAALLRERAYLLLSSPAPSERARRPDQSSGTW